MADNKKVSNYNLSTQYEEWAEEPWFIESVWNFFSAAWDFIWNRFWWDKAWSIQTAQDAQMQIDDLKEQYYNWDLSITEKNNIVKQISSLKQTRDDALSWEDKVWYKEPRDTFMRWVNPIWKKDIYEQVNPNKTYTNFLEDVDKDDTNLEALKKSLNANQKTYIDNLREQAKKDLREWKTTEDDILSGKYFYQKTLDNTRWAWYQWFLKDVEKDIVDNYINPQNIQLTSNDKVSYWFDFQASNVIDTIINWDDIKKSFNNSYEVIKKYESWANSDDPLLQSYANNQTAKNIYNEAVRNVNNLKEEVGYIYNHLWEYNWDIYSIENAYLHDTWRQMFMTAWADNQAWALEDAYSNSARWQSSEDFWASAAAYLRLMEWTYDAYKEHWSLGWRIWGWAQTLVKEWFYWIWAASNHLQMKYQNVINWLSRESNMIYNKLRIKTIPWVDLTWKEMDELVDWVNYWMSSLRSIKDQLTNNDSAWASLYNTALDVTDAWWMVSKEATTAMLTEMLMDSMMVKSTADIIADTAKGSDKYAKYVKYNQDLTKMFDTKWILYAKLQEFAWRWIVQNFALSASAEGSFAEDYTNLDFWLDLAFWLIDVYTFASWMMWGKGKILMEAKKSLNRQAIKDVLAIPDDMWEKLMLTESWRKEVDRLWDEMLKLADKSLDEAAKEASTTKDELIKQIKQLIDDSKKWSQEIFALSESARQEINWAIDDVVWQSMAKTIALAQEWLLPDNLKKKVEEIEVKTLDWWTRTKYRLTESLTNDEMKQVLSIWIWRYWSAWNRFNRYLEKWITDYKWRTMDYKWESEKLWEQNVSELWEKQRLEWEMKLEELNEQYSKVFMNTITDTAENWDRMVDFRRWEYEKYWRWKQDASWHYYQYWDIWYTYMAVWSNRAEAKAELKRRLREYAEEYNEINKEIKERIEKWWDSWILNYDLWVNKYSLEKSNQLTWKENVVWLSFEDACKKIPWLKDAWETFFDYISKADYLELYQKNMVLYSIPETKGKINKEKIIHIVSTREYTPVFWSTIEQEFFIWKPWTVWTVTFYDKEISDPIIYFVKKEHWKIFIHTKEAIFQVKEWQIRLVKSSKWSKIKNKADMVFKPNENWYNRMSWRFNLYWEQWDEFKKNIKIFDDVAQVEAKDSSKVENLIKALNMNKENYKWENKRTFWKKEEWKWDKKSVVNWYQSDYAEEVFKDTWKLWTLHHNTWYMNILWDFNIPFSFYMEIKRQVANWSITAKRWAWKIIASMNANIWENSWFFVLWWDSKVHKDMQNVLFHQSWVVVLSDNEWILYPAFYDKVLWSNWTYLLYKDSLNNPIWALYVDADTWLIRLWWVDDTSKNTYLINDMLIDKHITADYDTKDYRKIYRSDAYDEKRQQAFAEYLEAIKDNKYKDWIKEVPVDVIWWKKFTQIIRWDWTLNVSYNKDISVSKKDSKVTNELFSLKTIMSNWYEWSVKWMMEDFLNNSILKTFFNRNIWETDSICDYISHMYNEWVEWVKWLRKDWDQMKVIVDPSELWIKINYDWKNISFNINDKNIKWWRNVEIPFWKREIVTIDWDQYMEYVTNIDNEKWKEFYVYFKLDNSIEIRWTTQVNELALSKKDYINMMNNVDAIRSVTKKWWNMSFIVDNKYWFPPEILSIIDNWGSVSDIYSAMHRYILDNAFYKKLADVIWVNINDYAKIEALYWIYREWLMIENEIKTPLNNLWYKVNNDTILNYYKFIFGKWSFWWDDVTNLFKQLWLEAYRDWAANNNRANLIIEMVMLKEKWTMSKATYARMSDVIRRNKLAEFIEEYNLWVFNYDSETGKLLNLNNPAEWWKYLDNIKTAYEYAIRAVDMKDVRQIWSDMIRKWQSELWMWKKYSEIITAVWEVNTLQSILTKVDTYFYNLSQTYSRDTNVSRRLKRLKKKYPEIEWTDFWNDILYIWRTQYSLWMVAKKVNNLVNQYWEEWTVVLLINSLIKSNSTSQALDEVRKLRRRFINESSDYRWLFVWTLIQQDKLVLDELWIENFEATLKSNFDKLRSNYRINENIDNFNQLLELQEWIINLWKEHKDYSNLVELYNTTSDKIIRTAEDVKNKNLIKADSNKKDAKIADILEEVSDWTVKVEDDVYLKTQRNFWVWWRTPKDIQEVDSLIKEVDWRLMDISHQLNWHWEKWKFTEWLRRRLSAKKVEAKNVWKYDAHKWNELINEAKEIEKQIKVYEEEQAELVNQKAELQDKRKELLEKDKETWDKLPELKWKTEEDVNKLFNTSKKWIELNREYASTKLRMAFIAKDMEDIKKEFKWVDTLNYDLKEAEYKEKQKHLEEIEQEINDYKEEIKFWTNIESWYEPIEVDFDKEVKESIEAEKEPIKEEVKIWDTVETIELPQWKEDITRSDVYNSYEIDVERKRNNIKVEYKKDTKYVSYLWYDRSYSSSRKLKINEEFSKKDIRHWRTLDDYYIRYWIDKIKKETPEMVEPYYKVWDINFSLWITAKDNTIKKNRLPLAEVKYEWYGYEIPTIKLWWTIYSWDWIRYLYSILTSEQTNISWNDILRKRLKRIESNDIMVDTYTNEAPSMFVEYFLYWDFYCMDDEVKKIIKQEFDDILDLKLERFPSLLEYEKSSNLKLTHITFDKTWDSWKIKREVKNKKWLSDEQVKELENQQSDEEVINELEQREEERTWNIFYNEEDDIELQRQEKVLKELHEEEERKNIWKEKTEAEREKENKQKAQDLQEEVNARQEERRNRNNLNIENVKDQEVSNPFWFNEKPSDLKDMDRFLWTLSSKEWIWWKYWLFELLWIYNEWDKTIRWWHEILLAQTSKQEYWDTASIRKYWANVLKDENFNAFTFVKSEEWFEMILLCTFNKVSLPDEIKTALTSTYWISFDWTFEELENQIMDIYKATYNSLYNKNIYKAQKKTWDKVLTTISNDVIWYTKTDQSRLWYNSYVSQWLYFWDKYAEEYPFQSTALWNFTRDSFIINREIPEEHFWYWTKWIKQEYKSFADEYEIALDNMRKRWAYVDYRWNNWPMSAYEFYVLKHTEWAEQFVKDLLDVDKIMTWWKIDYDKIKRYTNIPFWLWHELYWNNDFYRNLLSEEMRLNYLKMFDSNTEIMHWGMSRNMKSFIKESIEHNDHNRLLSPYYESKRKDIKSLQEIYWKDADWSSLVLLQKPHEFKRNISADIFDWNKSKYDKIVVYWDDTLDIVKRTTDLDTLNKVWLETPEMIYVDEMEVHPKNIEFKDNKATTKEAKQIEDSVDWMTIEWLCSTTSTNVVK